MSAYAALAEYYDELTGDVPYNDFADYYERLFREYSVEVGLVLEHDEGGHELGDRGRRRRDVRVLFVEGLAGFGAVEHGFEAVDFLTQGGRLEGEGADRAGQDCQRETEQAADGHGGSPFVSLHGYWNDSIIIHLLRPGFKRRQAAAGFFARRAL